MRVDWLRCGVLLLCMIRGLVNVAIDSNSDGYIDNNSGEYIAMDEITEDDMDDALEKAQKISNDRILKNTMPYIKGQNNSGTLTESDEASKDELEMNTESPFAMLALKCLLKKKKIDYIKIKDNENFRVIWDRKIKLLCDQTQKKKITCDPEAKYRNFDGTCNNLRYPLWGAAMTPQRRWLSPQYDDYLNSPRQTSVLGGKLPNALEVSEGLFRLKKKPSKNKERTLMLMAWEEFLYQDIEKTPKSTGKKGAAINCCGKNGPINKRPECLPISIPKNDPYFGKYGKRCINYVRSLAATDCELEHREQLNEMTAYIDASILYGSTKAEAAMLRTDNGRGARLKTEPNNLSPKDLPVTRNLQSKKRNRREAGDGRVDAFPGLGAMDTIFTKEHNRIVGKLEDLKPNWSNEKFFQETRIIVGAMMQHITYSEFLPNILGNETMRNHSSNQQGYGDIYDPNANPTTMNAFFTAALRHGLSPQKVLMNGGKAVNEIVRRSLRDQTSLTGSVFGDGVRNPPFENSTLRGLELVAINIQRGRDHGLPGYNNWRVKSGLERATSFSGLSTTHDEDSRNLLQKAYRHVDDIDLFAGAVSETHLEGSSLGPTFTSILTEQFRNLRSGDRFFFTRSDKQIGFTPEQLEEIKKVKLAKIICNNMDVDEIQPDCLKVPNNWSNRRRPCEELVDIDLGKWKE